MPLCGIALELDPKGDTVFCAYLTISDIVGELVFPGCEILYYQQGQFDFPVDTSINVEVIPNKKAISKARAQRKKLKDLGIHALQSDNDVNLDVDENLAALDELEADLLIMKEPMYVMSYIIRVTAPSEDELERRCNSVLDYYDDFSIKLVRPVGDMMNFHTEFIPSSRRINMIVNRIKSDYLAALGFGAAQDIGDKEGIAIGYTKYSGTFFWLKPWLAAQGIGGTKTNSLSAAFIGSLGGGKSFFNNMVTLLAVLFGAKAVIIDPKSERGKWADMLPDIAHEIDVINLTSNEKNKGMLDPFVIMKSNKEAESLALEVLTFLMGITIQDDKKYPVLRRAVRAVSNYENKGLMFVIDELKKDGSEVALQLAGHIESFTDFDVAHLLFSNGDVQNKISLDKRLTIIQIADLVMPNVNTKASEYSTSEMLSVAMLIAISTFCLDFIHSDKSTFKITNLDEAWSLFNVSQGAALINKLVREGRSMNSGVYLSTQNAKDLQDERIKSNIGMFFVFRSSDDEEIKSSLRLLGVDENDKNNQNMIKELENGECVMKDIYGRVNVVKIEYLLPELKHTFDTRPHKQEQETRQAG